MTGVGFWQRVVFTVCLFVVYSRQNTEHNICSQGDMTGDAIMLTLNTTDVNEECCCILQVMSDGRSGSSSGDPTVLVFVEFSCTLTFTKTYNWLSGISCNGTGSWKAVTISKTMDICVNRTSVKTTPVGRLGFNNTGTGHDWTFSLSCNSSGHPTPQSSVPTSPVSSVSTTASPVSSVPTSTSPASSVSTTVSSSVSTNNEEGELERTSNDQGESQQFPIGAVVGIVVAIFTVIVAIAVVFFFLRRKRNAKQPPLDDATARYRTDSLYSDDGVIMRTNSLYTSSGTDNTGYYQKQTVNRSSSEAAVPKKQLFKVDKYSSNRNNKSTSANTLNDIVLNVDTSPEDASFVY